MTRLTRRRFVASSGALAVMPALASQALDARGQAVDAGDLRVEKDIAFGIGGSKTLTLDVYHPLAGTTAKRTAVVHLFAGGFAAGTKDANYIVNDAKALATRGYASVAATYRLAREGPWPSQIHDAKAAIRWTRANAARLGVEPNRIVVAGYGAGGLLALLAAGTGGRAEFEGASGTPGISSRVDACIGVYPLATPENAAALFPPERATRENLTAASPATYISKDFAPTIFIHGTDDATVPVQSSIDFWSKLHGFGVPAALNLVQGADGAFDTAALDAVEMMAHAIDLFLDRLLVNPVPYPKFGGRGRGQGGRGGPPPTPPGAN